MSDVVADPTVLLDDDGHVIFVHDCLALCGDGETRLIPNRHYVLGIPPWSMTADGLDLTISPSIQCLACQLHGYFRDGHWEPA